MNHLLDVESAEIAALCKRWKIRRLDIFGSALRDDFGPDSDVDLLVEYAQEATWTLFDEARIQEELEELFRRPIDLISRNALESSPNWIRKESILSSSEPVYVEPK